MRLTIRLGSSLSLFTMDFGGDPSRSHFPNHGDSVHEFQRAGGNPVQEQGIGSAGPEGSLVDVAMTVNESEALVSMHC